MATQYSALIMDLVKSKAYQKESRNQLQLTICHVLDQLNNVFNKSISKKVDFSAGDEVQGLFVSAQAAYQYYRLFSMLLHPVKLRAGIGVGTWDIQLLNKGTAGQDGIAYHRARLAINCADELDGILINSNRFADKIINAAINAAAMMCRDHSDHQNGYYILSELLSPLATDSIVNSQELLQASQLLWAVKETLWKKKLQLNVWPETQLLSSNNSNEKETFYITEGKQRGLPTALAALTGVSRQSAESIIKAGNIYTIRNITLAAVTAMERLNTEEDIS